MKRLGVMVLATIIALVLGYLAIRYLVPFLLPFLLAIVLAVMIDPLVNWIENRTGIPRSLAVIGCLVLVLGGLGGLLFLSMSQLVKELLVLSRELPAYFDEFMARSRSILDLVERMERTLPEPVRSALQSQEAELYDLASHGLGMAVDFILGLFRLLPSLFIIIVISCIATFFLSRDKKMVSDLWWRIVPDHWHRQVGAAKRDLIRSTFGLLVAQLFLVGVTTVLTALGFLLIGGRYAVTLGIVAGILDLVPYVGPSLVIGPWAIITFIRGDIVMGLKLIGLLSVVALVRQFLEVRIVGERTGIHPLVILFSLYVGVRLFGPAGFVLGPLVAIIVKSVVMSGLLQLLGGWGFYVGSTKAHSHTGVDRVHRSADTGGGGERS